MPQTGPLQSESNTAISFDERLRGIGLPAAMALVVLVLGTLTAVWQGNVLKQNNQRYVRERFETITANVLRDLKTEFPGALGFGFALRVPREREAQFLEAAH